MSGSSSVADTELSALQTVCDALQPLDEAARGRILSYVSSRFTISLAPSPQTMNSEPGVADEGEAITAGVRASEATFSSLAELFDAAQPKSNAEKVLIAGYWFQVCGGAANFDGQSANKELKNLGEGVTNVTKAIDSLKSHKPALALQLKKSGKSQQARKIYMITVAGIKAVEEMLIS